VKYICALHVNLMSENRNIMQKKAEAVLSASREFVVEVNAEKPKSCHQSAGHNCRMNVANKTFDIVSQLRCLKQR
jgi:hypothetical protein